MYLTMTDYGCIFQSNTWIRNIAPSLAVSPQPESGKEDGVINWQLVKIRTIPLFFSPGALRIDSALFCNLIDFMN